MKNRYNTLPFLPGLETGEWTKSFSRKNYQQSKQESADYLGADCRKELNYSDTEFMIQRTKKPLIADHSKFSDNWAQSENKIIRGAYH